MLLDPRNGYAPTGHGVTVPHVALDRTKTARGALAGAAAAGIWSAQSQLDRRLFGVDYLDEALLGKAITRGSA